MPIMRLCNGRCILLKLTEYVSAEDAVDELYVARSDLKCKCDVARKFNFSTCFYVILFLLRLAI